MAQPGYEGFAALGQMLGGGVGKPGVYEDTLKKAYSADEQLQQARRARSLALIDSGRLDNRNAVTPALLQAALGGDIEAQATLGSSVLGSNSTMNMGQLGDYQRPHYGQNLNTAQEALEAGNIPTYNKFNAAAEGKNYQPVRALGGSYIEDGVALDDLDMVPTLGTLNAIKRTDAAIDQGQQRTNASVAKSNRAPASHSSGGGGKAPSAAAAEAGVLAEARAAIAAGAPKAAVAGRLKERGYSKLAGRL
jgi:hypothetical protein